MEEAVANCPDLFIEPGLNLVRRQVVINGRRPDLLFSNVFSHHLLVDIQCGKMNSYKIQNPTGASASMKPMNENASLRLREFMAEDDGWGRPAGRETFAKIISFVESHPGAVIFRVSLKGVRRVDISFASESVVEIARKYRSFKGFCFVDLEDANQQENWTAAAERAKQPLFSWHKDTPTVIGPQPARGMVDALQFAIHRSEVRASEFALTSGTSITNASTKFKQLWEQGFLLRRERSAESGGVEFTYRRIR